MKRRICVVAVMMSWVFLVSCGGAPIPKTSQSATVPRSGTPTSTAPETEERSNPPQKLTSAEEAIERAKVVLSREKAARYEATHLDDWLPTAPTDRDRPRAAWKVKLFDAANRQIGWVVLDEETGGPLQMGNTHPD